MRTPERRPDAGDPEPMTTSTRPRGARTRHQRRRLSGFLALVFALVAAGGLYTVLAPRPQTAQAADGPLPQPLEYLVRDLAREFGQRFDRTRRR